MNNGLNLNFKRSTVLSVLAAALLLTFTISLFAVPIASAHTPAWTVPTYAYIAVTPNPVGVNQNVFVMMWLNWPPPTAAGSAGDRWQNFRLTITRPDGTTENKGPFTSDATSSAYLLYTPTATGTYTFKFDFPGQVASLVSPVTGEVGSASAYVNDTFTASTASTTLTVQQEQLTPVTTYPLPTSYWTRPIEGENSQWDSIASNFLGTGSGQIQGGGGFGGGGVQLDGIAPNSAHVMWTRPLQDGGVTGGLYALAEGATYYPGLSYQGRMAATLIINGRVYFDTPLSDDPSKGPYTCIDLRTGETIWANDNISPTFGQLYNYESMNQHGVIGDGYLWQVVGSTWVASDPRTSAWLFNLTGVPSGTTVYGPNGEIMRYRIVYDRNTNTGWLGLWNNTAAVGEQGGTVGSAVYQWRPLAGNRNIDASAAYSWNVSVAGLVGAASPQILSVVPDDVIIGTSTAMPAFSAFGTPDPMTFWAISLKPQNRGQLLWIKNIAQPAGNLTWAYFGSPSSGSTNLQVDSVNRVWFLTNKETMLWYGYDMDTGNQLWGPVGVFNSMQYYGTVSNPPAPGYVYDGKLIVGGYGGIINAIASRTGQVVWTYGNGGVGNSTASGLETPWGNYPTFIGAIADGKVYVFSSEHSPNVPPYKDEKVRCLDAATGEEIWTMLSWPGMGGFGQLPLPIADGFMIYLNTYDNQIYCLGKGPSTTTVEAPLAGVTLGQSLIIQGNVLDISAGAKAKIASGEFSSVPAVSDASQSAWMQYIYMQKPCPATATGVQVKLVATDATGTSMEIATVTSDANGLYSYAWVPETKGKYVITATFEGSESYWPSSSSTAISVDAAATQPVVTPTPTETVTPTETPMETATPTVAPQPDNGIATETLLIAAAAVIIVVAVVAAALVLRKRK